MAEWVAGRGQTGVVRMDWEALMFGRYTRTHRRWKAPQGQGIQESRSPPSIALQPVTLANHKRTLNPMHHPALRSVDLVTEQGPAISLAYEPAEGSIMDQPPR
jgi:hypothetical protein